jgi:hypothetical protein
MLLEKWYTLQGTNHNEKWQGRVNLFCRWVHSKVKLYTDLMALEDGEIKAQDTLLEDYRAKLDSMQVPFWWMEGE